MKKYKVHENLIDSVYEIYKEDRTVLEVGKLKTEIEITSGIRQGCNLSTTLFKIITFQILEEINSNTYGFKSDIANINMLFSADDGLMLSPSIRQAKVNIKRLIPICKKYGLELNIPKSYNIIFNMKDQPDQIENIKVVNSIKYLGINICNKKDLFSEYRKTKICKARQMAAQTFSVLNKSCNRIMVGKKLFGRMLWCLLFCMEVQ